LIKNISTRYFLVIKEIKKISSRYDFDQYFRSGMHCLAKRPLKIKKYIFEQLLIHL
jgi:hypothetical protein